MKPVLVSAISLSLAACTLFAEAATSGNAGGPPACLVAESAKPNIVIFIADDLSWHDVACFGGPTDAKTPNLDRLAGEGIKLTGFFSSASVCAPTRQALLTGLYPVRSGAYPNNSFVKPGTKSLPHYLTALGYRSACIGKTHFAPRANYPFTKFLPMTGERPEAKGEDGGDGEIDTQAMTRFIQSQAGQPFCLYIAPHEPHAPWTKGDPSAYALRKLKIPPYLVDTDVTRHWLAAYYAEVSCLDAEVGEVLKMLENTGHSHDTLFLFVSEQGSSMPHAKWTCYDPGIRVAAIARWPGKIKPGSENAALVQYVDVLPTLLEAAGGQPPSSPGGIDGRSLLGVLLGRTDRHRDYVFAQHTARGIINGPAAYGTRSVRDARWKLIVNLEPGAEFSNILTAKAGLYGGLLASWRKKGEAGDAFAESRAAFYTKRPAVELYDLRTDPWELTNVAADPGNAGTINRLRAQLDAWMKQQGDQGDKTEREANERQIGKHK
jgi:uncharacterized sulfatase